MKYYKLPLKVDPYCPSYIYDSVHTLALNYIREDDIINDDYSLLYEIIGAINGHNDVKYNISFEDDIIYVNNIPTLLIRGWGYLTGIGGYNLTFDEAIEEQNKLKNYIINRLSNENLL